MVNHFSLVAGLLLVIDTTILAVTYPIVTTTPDAYRTLAKTRITEMADAAFTFAQMATYYNGNIKQGAGGDLCFLIGDSSAADGPTKLEFHLHVAKGSDNKITTDVKFVNIYPMSELYQNGQKVTTPPGKYSQIEYMEGEARKQLSLPLDDDLVTKMNAVLGKMTAGVAMGAAGANWWDEQPGQRQTRLPNPVATADTDGNWRARANSVSYGDVTRHRASKKYYGDGDRTSRLGAYGHGDLKQYHGSGDAHGYGYEYGSGSGANNSLIGLESMALVLSVVVFTMFCCCFGVVVGFVFGFFARNVTKLDVRKSAQVYERIGVNVIE